MTVLLEWVDKKRTVVGWENRWTEGCVGWVSELLHCVEGKVGGWGVGGFES